ncbi:metallophosphoesterase [Celeribacter sp.]|uniref:metallophosphoesterase n=1 Tax=Celeribacter sp. TaxID=1890673 RepID=UPI003A9545E3
MNMWKRLRPRSTAKTTSPQNSQRMLRKFTLHTTPAVTYAVGDIHGHFDLYRKLEAQIIADAAAFHGPALIILLGDMIDRGPNSAQLLDHLITPPPDGITRVCLRGNHEDMFLHALDTPSGAKDWITWGGAQTLASYGIHPDPETGYEFDSTRWRQTLAAAIPQSHRSFLRDMPLCVSLPDWFFSHAGINPERAIDDQTKDDLIWGNPSALAGRGFAKRIVHGHVPVDEVRFDKGAINVDTGAFVTGVLSAVRLVKDHDVRPMNVTLHTPDPIL